LIRRVLIVGGGSAGFLAALALKTRMPELDVRVVRSKEIGIIGVGEGSTPALTRFLHEYLAITPGRFFEVARPTWKLGLRFLWGPRTYFNYSFNQAQLSGRIKGLRKAKAFYCWDEMAYEDPISALMTEDRAFERMPNRQPAMHGSVAYHFENEKFVTFLEEAAAALGVTILDETIVEVKLGNGGVEGLRLESGSEEIADLYIDASGFGSLLLGKALAEPFLSFDRTLFCDRAVVGGWDRSEAGEQVIKPYTTCETMEAGWCWQIEHENRINRGYVYSSSFVTEEAAEKEFREKNPKVKATRVVHFTSGRYQRLWVKNVVAVGNAGRLTTAVPPTVMLTVLVPAEARTVNVLAVNVPPVTLKVALMPGLLTAAEPPMARMPTAAVPPVWLYVSVVPEAVDSDRPTWRISLPPLVRLRVPVPLRLKVAVEPVFTPMMTPRVVEAKPVRVPALRL